MRTINLLQKVREQESFLLKTRDNLLSRNIQPYGNKTFDYNRAVMIGMIDMLDVLNIDRTEFNWIF